MDANLQTVRQTLQARLAREFDEREKRRIEALRAAQAAIPLVASTYPKIKTIYLFGSILVAGAFYMESDIDIAVEGIDPVGYFELWHDLEAALPNWDIDLRDLPANTQFTGRVKQRGIKIYG
jgi:predicted nucleotidyltransferase